MNIGIDFDDCLRFNRKINPVILRIMCAHAFIGDKLFIVTARTERHENPFHCKNFFDLEHKVLIRDFIDEHQLPIHEVHFTNHMLKGPFLKNLDISRHYDDKHEHLHSAHEHGIEAYRVSGEKVKRYNPNEPFDFCLDRDCLVCERVYE